MSLKLKIGLAIGVVLLAAAAIAASFLVDLPGAAKEKSALQELVETEIPIADRERDGEPRANGEPGANGKPETGPEEGPPAEKTVAATVNGVPIYEEDVEAGMDPDAFGMRRDIERSQRLDNLIYIELVGQFCVKKNIKVPDAVIDAEVAELRENPPAAGCSCCRYDSLEDFLTANCFTLSEFKDVLRVNIGVERYIDGLWAKEYPGEKALKKAVEEEREALKKDYIKVSHIFFNVFQDPEFSSDPDAARERKGKEARQAWERLEKGDGFARVVEEESEDYFSRPEGGSLGCIPSGDFGPVFEKAALAQEAGVYGRPVESPWGFHIILREEMTDSDLLAIMKDNFIFEAEDLTYTEIYDEADIVIAGEEEDE